MRTLPFIAILLATSLHAATQITWKRQQLHGDFYSEGAAIGDINGDGKPDVVAGPFWWEGPAFEKKHAYYEPKIFSINGYSDNFFAYVHDFDGDQKNDILILGFPGKEARLYLNPGTHDDKPWPMHIVADVVDNESPVFTDITGDGKPEIVCSSGGRLGYFEPKHAKKPTDKWPFVFCSDDLGMGKFTHGLGVGDVDGDGMLDFLEAKHWWRNTGLMASGGVMVHGFEQHSFALGVGGGAQMFAYDFDGNGTNDVFTALAAHRYGVAVFLQNKPEPNKPTWQRVMLASEQPQDNDYGIVFSQPHAAHLADIDGDGIKDIVTGKRYWAHNGHDPDERGHRVIYWYQTKRDGKGGVDFVPHLVDAESGVGVDVQVGDVNGDTLPDIVVGNKAGVYVLTQQRSETTADLTPKKLYGPALKPQAEYAKGQSAQDALKSMQLPTGFKAELIAAEPDVVQPIAFTFDERGRIWVVEGNSYPQPREVGKGQDRIKILEDKDGDGTFETKKIFCEGLNLVSGIELGFGGVWVGAAPYLMFIPRDGDRPAAEDGRSKMADGTKKQNPSSISQLPSPAGLPEAIANLPRVPGLPFPAYALLDGWGTQDTHETLNSFIWGPDGWLYGCHGVFTHSRVGKPGTPDEKREPINAGVWRYHPVRHEFEVFAHGTSNPWGLDYDQHGEWFVTACVIPHLYHIVPGGRYHRQAGQHFNAYTYEDIKTIADHAHYAGNPRPDVTFDKTTGAGVMNNDTNALGGGHAHCGLAIYQSSLFPPTYRNQLLFGNLHGHRLVANYTDPHASTYIGKHAADFMRANDMHFIPVTQKVGPDGALYVSDWSDQQICHRGSGAVEHWDRSNGRLYRISYDGWKPWKGDLAKESDEALAKLAVQTENEWESRMARRVLEDRAQVKNITSPDGEWSQLVHTLREWEEDAQQNGPIGRELKLIWLKCLLGLPPRHFGEFYYYWESDLGRAAGIRASMDFWLMFLEDDPTYFDLNDFAGKIARERHIVVRREAASLLRKWPTNHRQSLATALLSHGEDADDPMIPLLIWYGIEPVVAADAAAGLQLAAVSKMPKVTEFIYRRLSTEPAGRDTLLRALAGLEVAKMASPISSGDGAPPSGGTAGRNGGSAPTAGGSAPPKGGSAAPSGGVAEPNGGGVPPRGGAPAPSGGSAGPNGGVTPAQNSAPISSRDGGPAAGGAPIASGGGSPRAKTAQAASFTPAEKESILAAVVATARGAGRLTPPADWPAIAAGLRAGATPRTLALVQELAALFGDAAALDQFRATLADAKRAAGERQAALSLLIQAGDAGTAKVLQAMLGDSATPGGLRRQALQSLASLKDAETPRVIAAALPKLSANEVPDAVNTLASTPEGAIELLKAVKAKKLASTALSPFLARQLAALKNPEVDALLKETFGDVNAPKADLAARVKKYRELLTPAALKKADLAKGRLIFTATCGTCHVLFGQGQKVGPDITGSNRADLGYLLENVLDPNAVIGKDYQLNIFAMNDGRVVSGIVKQETDQIYRIAMPGGVEFTLNKADVKSREVSKASTMPEGLFDALPPEMVIDLTAYLQSGGAGGRTSASVEGAMEGETMKVLSKTGGTTKTQGMSGFGSEWSGGSQLWWTGGSPGQKLTLALPVAKAGKYSLTAALTKARDYGVVGITLDGKPVASTFDGYNGPKVIHTGELDWGTHDLTTGEHQLTFTLAPPNPDAVPSNMVGIDYVKLTPVK